MGIWKDKTRRDWRYSFQHRGKAYAGGGLSSRREAIAAREERKKDLRSVAAKTKTTGTAFSDMAKKYLDYSERKHAAKTYKYKAYVYASFIRYAGDLPFDGITPMQIHEYLNTRPSNNNYNVHRKDLHALWAFAQTQLKMDIYNPCQHLAKMPHTYRAKAVPSEEEILRLILAADPKTDERDLFLCCLHTLGRIDELLRLTWQDVNFDSRVVTLWTRKRKDGVFESDPLPMNQDLFDVLLNRWKGRSQEVYVFWNEKAKEGRGDRYKHRPKFMAGLCKRAGIEPVGKGKGRDLYYGFHSIRHFMASYLADKGKVGTQAISKMLRHRSLKTTEIYLHSIDETQRLAMTSVEGIFTPQKDDPQASTASIKKEGANGVR